MGLPEIAPLARTILYSAFTVWTFLTFLLAAAFVGTTISDFGLYWNASAELIAAGLLGLLVVPLHFVFHRRNVGTLSKTWVELAVLGVLWLLFLGGAAALSTDLPAGAYCRGYRICDLASAVQAFAWLGWITLTLLLGLILTTSIMEQSRGRKTIWSEPWSLTHSANNQTLPMAQNNANPAPVAAA